MKVKTSSLLCPVVLVVGLSFAVVDAHAQGQCGDPDPGAIVLDDADIYDVDVSTMITVIDPWFPDNSLIGHYLAISMDWEPPEYYRIISNEHHVQWNISTFTVVENIEGDGTWWFYAENSLFDIVAPIACEECVLDDECDDGDACTTDTCDPDEEFCVYTPIDCDDADACTADSCSGGACANDPISCDDGDACTVDSCDSVSGCANVAIDCDDGDACTSDSCSGGVCSNDPICGPADGCCDSSCDPGGDPDCFVCGEKGDPCSGNSDCCSNRCRRKTSTCR